MQDMTKYIVLKILTGNVQYKKHGEFAGLLRHLFTLDSLQTFCQIILFFLVRFVSVGVLSIYVLTHQTLCLFGRIVRIHIVTLKFFCHCTLFPLDILPLYILLLNQWITYVKHRCALFLNLLYSHCTQLYIRFTQCGWLNRKSLNEYYQFVLDDMGPFSNH